MRILDLFCGAGGAAMGYHRAGFDVIGVDIAPQPDYPFSFHQADVLDVLAALTEEGWPFDLFPTALDNLAAIHASPPCQAFSLATQYHPGVAETHPDLIAPVRELLDRTGLPFVIENVAGAPIKHDLMLCGEMFGLRLHRHRYFESGGGFQLTPAYHPQHKLRGAEHNCDLREGHARQVAGNYADHESASAAMGIDWMTRRELAEAIPPAYTEFIGAQLIDHLNGTPRNPTIFNLMGS